MKKYRLIVNEKQAKVLERALEVFARIGIGQIQEAFEILPLRSYIHDSSWFRDMEEIRSILKQHTTNEVDGWRSSLGISSKDVSEESKIAWDIHQVIRHRISWDRAVEEGIVESENSPRDWKKMVQVSYDEPMKTSGERLPQIYKEEVNDLGEYIKEEKDELVDY